MDPRVRFRVETTVFFVAALGFCAAATHQQWFRTFDLALYDTLTTTFPAPLHDNLLIVGIDERSIGAYGAWPWPRTRQARLLDVIGAGAPDAVLLDIVFSGRTEPVADRALADAAARLGTLALPILIDALATNQQLVEVLPYPDLLEVADVLGHAHVELDADAIARGVYLHQGVGEPHWSHVAHALAEHQGHTPRGRENCGVSETFTLQNVRCDFVYLPFAGPPGTLPEISAADLLTGAIDASVLAGRVVFVGITTAAAPDSITSPVSSYGRPMAGVEFNANLYNSLIQDRAIQAVGLSLLLSLALACVALPVLLLPRLRPKPMLAATLGFAAVPLLMTIAGYRPLQLHLPLAAAITTCLLCYPYWSWRRHEIAWQFVDAEISRLGVERSRWVTAKSEPAEDAASPLGALLEAEPVWYEAPPAIEHDRQITVRGPSNRWLVLSRGHPFTEQERHFVEQLEPSLREERVRDRLPGEMLAAEIKKLQQAAEEVRLGREVGLKGLEEMPIGVAVISPLNQVLLANHAWRRLMDLKTGIDRLTLSDVVAGLVPPLGTSWREINRTVLLERQRITFETQTPAATPVVIEAAPLADTTEFAEPWVITLTDVSDVRMAERNREEALAFLSHDLRSPMLSVLALVRSVPETSLLSDIGRYAQKALSVSDQFLQLSRVQARERFEVYDVDLSAVLQNAIDHVFHFAQENDITMALEQNLVEEDAAWLSGNGEMLERAFVNLLTNAIKYGDRESSVQIQLSEEEKNFVVTVSDEGIGIPADELDKIFDPYFRSSEPRLAEQRGTGLGLRFVKTVVERHGGSIAVSSRLNEGSRFTVTLPGARDNAIDQ